MFALAHHIQDIPFKVFDLKIEIKVMVYSTHNSAVKWGIATFIKDHKAQQRAKFFKLCTNTETSIIMLDC